MRKSLSLAVCAITLAAAGPLAAIEAKALAPLSEPLSTRIEQALQLLRGAPAQVKTQLGAPDGGGNSRSLSRTQSAQNAQTPAPDEERGSYVMALAGLMIMGVIIRRRYGKGD